MRRLLGLFITIILISCSTDSNTFTLQGTAEGYEDGTTIYVYEIGGDNRPVILDTINVQQGAFSSEYAKSDAATVNYLNIQGAQANVIYFPENTDLKVTLYKDSLAASHVTGGEKNESYYEFSQTIKEFNNKKRDQANRFQQAKQQQDGLLAQQIQQENLALLNEEAQYKKNFVGENNDNLFSVMLLSEMVNRKEVTGAEAIKILDNLSPRIAQAKISRDIRTNINNLSKAEIGSVAPDFTAPTPEGDMLSLKDALGKYTIIDFWASWCKPCRRENPNVVSVYNKYHEQGLNIISVSLDRSNQKDRWIKAIADDNMDWYHVSNLKFWSDPIARTYNVKAIPATFLLDEDGNIIAKDLRGQALQNKMASLFQ